MENASKALIIAGAILLSILIIAIGMYIYNSSTNSINGAVGQISQQEVSAFNNQFTMYDGKQVGTNIKALIQLLVSNAQENAEEATRLPDLYYEAASGSSATVSSTVSDTNIDELNSARSTIQSRHYYYVTLLLSDTTGLVNGIVVSYAHDDYSTAAGKLTPNDD